MVVLGGKFPSGTSSDQEASGRNTIVSRQCRSAGGNIDWSRTRGDESGGDNLTSVGPAGLDERELEVGGGGGLSSCKQGLCCSKFKVNICNFYPILFIRFWLVNGCFVHMNTCVCVCVYSCFSLCLSAAAEEAF